MAVLNSSPTYTILSDTDWKEELYPKKKYLQRREFALHFLIALEQPLETIRNYIQQLIKEGKITRLYQADRENYLLTPLHIAAMKSNNQIITLIFNELPEQEKIASLTASDSFGWTPLHHAALSSNSTFQTLHSLGGNPELLTQGGSNCTNIQILVGRISDIRSQKTLFIKDEVSGSVKLVAESDKEIVFGKNFRHTDSPLFSLHFLQELWKFYPTYFDQPSFDIYEKFKTSPPPLVIQLCPQLKELEHPFECVAKEKIPAGKIISEYSGQRVTQPTTVFFLDIYTEENRYLNDYFLNLYDARHVGNEARFFNCGFPNAHGTIVTARGCERTCIMSLREISPGEAIYWDYGAHPSSINYGTQILFNKEEMCLFFASSDLKKRLNDKTLSSQIYLHYPLNNPTALLFLHFSKILDYSFWSTNFDTDHLLTWQGRYPHEKNLIISLFDILEKIKKLSSQNETNQSLINKWVLSHLEKTSLINIVKGLELIVKRAHNSTELTSLLKRIDDEMPTFSFSENDHPFKHHELDSNSMSSTNLYSLLLGLKGLNK